MVSFRFSGCFAWLLRCPSTASLALRQSYCFRFLLHWTDVFSSWLLFHWCIRSRWPFSFRYLSLTKSRFPVSFHFLSTFVPSQVFRLLALKTSLQLSAMSLQLSLRFVTTTDSSAICTTSISLVFQLVQCYFSFDALAKKEKMLQIFPG